jgi:hypothetical protein
VGTRFIPGSFELMVKKGKEMREGDAVVFAIEWILRVGPIVV